MFKRFDKKARVVLVTHGMYTFTTQFLAQYNILFAQALGASGADIGLMTLVSALVLFASSPFIGLAIERYSIKKMMILGLICDLTAMIVFVLASDWRQLILAFILYQQLIRQIPLADLVFITFTEPRKRATLLGLSRVLWGATAIFAPLIAAMVVTYYGGINVHGIRPLYCISFPILLAILLMLYKGLDESSISNNAGKVMLPQEKARILDEYRRFFKSEKYLKHWIAIRLFRDGSMWLMMTFVPLWIVNVRGATATLLGTLSTLSTVSGLLVQIPAGRLADKVGRKKTFLLFTTFYCLGIITLAFAPTFEYLILASILGMGVGGIVGGGIGGAAITPLMTMWWEAVSCENRGKLYGLEGIIMAASKLPTVIGGFLWDQGLEMLIMLIPLLVEILIVVPLVYTIRETLNAHMCVE